jgi:hypothetical protein
MTCLTVEPRWEKMDLGLLSCLLMHDKGNHVRYRREKGPGGSTVNRLFEVSIMKWTWMLKKAHVLLRQRSSWTVARSRNRFWGRRC